MGRIFEDIKLSFDGVDYTIPSNMVLGAIARIEDIVTLKELHETSNARGTLKLVPIARAYASVLRYAGANVTDDEVYAGMFAGGPKSQQAVIAAVTGLVSMMIPPSAVREQRAAQGNPNRQARRAAARLSRKRSAPRADRNHSADSG